MSDVRHGPPVPQLWLVPLLLLLTACSAKTPGKEADADLGPDPSRLPYTPDRITVYGLEGGTEELWMELTFVYDHRGLLDSLERVDYTGGAAASSRLWSFGMPRRDQVQEISESQLQSGEWVDYWTAFYHYDTEERLERVDIDFYVENSHTREHHRYDDAGRLEMIEVEFRGPTTDFTWMNREVYAYDGAGRLASLREEQYLSGAWSLVRTFTSTFDGDGRVSQVDMSYPNGSTFDVAAFTYDGSGRLSRRDWFSSNVTFRYVWDDLTGRLVTANLTTSDTGAPYQRWEFSYRESVGSFALEQFRFVDPNLHTEPLESALHYYYGVVEPRI